MPKPNTTPTTFEVDGSVLRETRMLRGLEIRELAEQVGCDRSYISLIENGHRRRISPSKFRAILDALGLSHPSELQPKTEMSA